MRIQVADFHSNMVLTLWRVLVIGGALLWNVLCSDNKSFIEEGKEFTLDCPQVNSSGTPTWSRNDSNLSEWAGNTSYHVTSARFNDSGVYTCTRSGVVEFFEVQVGRKPTVHGPVCFNSPNTTILCTAGVEDAPNTTLCLEVFNIFLGEDKVGTQCNEGNVTFILHLEEFKHHTYNFKTRVSNPFGQRTKMDQFSNLEKKVIPQPPIHVEMIPDGVDSFNMTFTIPPPWDVTSNLQFSYVVIQDDLTSYHHKRTPLTKLPFKLQVRQKPYSLVCLKIRMEYSRSGVWGVYSLPKCQRTTEAAPSTGPSSIRATSVQDKYHPGYRNITVTWDPPDEHNRNGIICQYSVTLENEMVNFTNDENNYEPLMRVLINGSVTRCTLSGIPSYQPIKIKVKAWTKMGASPESIYTLDPLPETRDESNPVVWILVGCCCLAIFLASLRCFFVVRRKLLSEHLPEPFFIHPSKVPTFQSLPPQREVFDSLNRRPGILQEANPHRGISAPSMSHGEWISSKENSGRNAFTGTDSGISCDTENPSTNQNCRCSDLTNKRESSSVCTYTGLPNDTNELQCNENKLHHGEVTVHSSECSDQVHGCNLILPTNNSHTGYKRPPPPRVLGNDKWKYVLMGTGRVDGRTGNCCVQDSIPESDMEVEGYITMKCNVLKDDQIPGDAMQLLEQQLPYDKQEKMYKEELSCERKVIDASHSVTLQKALTDDELNFTKLNLEDFVRDNPHALLPCQDLKQIGKEGSTGTVDKNIKDSSFEFIKCSNNPTEDGSVFTKNNDLNSRVGLTSSRPSSRIERDSGYTSDD